MNKQTICLFLNSQSATSYVNQYTSECLFDLPNLVVPRRSKISVAVQTASIPFSFFNCDNFNDVFNYSVNGIAYSAVIPQGNYNVLTLASALRTILGANFTITYAALDNSYTFTNTTNAFQLLKTSTCFEMLGFSSGFTYSSAANIIKSTISINLFTIRNIYVSSNNFLLHNVNNATPNNCNILCSIPIMSSSGSIITYSNFYNAYYEVHNVTNLTFLHLKLTDQDGDILDLNGCHFSVTLQLDIETNPL